MSPRNAVVVSSRRGKGIRIEIAQQTGCLIPSRLTCTITQGISRPAPMAFADPEDRTRSRPRTVMSRKGSCDFWPARSTGFAMTENSFLTEVTRRNEHCLACCC